LLILGHAAKTPDLSEYLTVGEAAEFLGVSPSTLRNWDRAGKLNPRRHPVNGYRLYVKSELERLLKTIRRPSGR
jgi:MerR family transcriptional regulator, copper efflux regulator